MVASAGAEELLDVRGHLTLATSQWKLDDEPVPIAYRGELGAFALSPSGIEIEEDGAERAEERDEVVEEGQMDGGGFRWSTLEEVIGPWPGTAGYGDEEDDQQSTSKTGAKLGVEIAFELHVIKEGEDGNGGFGDTLVAGR